MTSKIIRVIHSAVTEGTGIESDPVRLVHYYFDLKGALIAKEDPCPGAQKPDVMALTRQLDEQERFNTYLTQELKSRLEPGPNHE